MGWFVAGFFVSILCSLVYIVCLMNNKSREWLAENIFGDSIYGDVLSYLVDKEKSPMEEEDLLLGLFVLLISTAGILILVIALLTIFGYISLFIFILFVLSFIASSIIKKKKQNG